METKRSRLHSGKRDMLSLEADDAGCNISPSIGWRNREFMQLELKES